MPAILQWALYILGVLVACLAGYVIRKHIGEGKINQAEEQAKNILIDAQRDAETTKKDLLNVMNRQCVLSKKLVSRGGGVL